MIKNIVFDFGDVFISLDKSGAMNHALNLFKMESFDSDIISINESYEIGAISSKSFIDFYTHRFPWTNNTIILEAWNLILKDFPLHRLEFIKALKKRQAYKLILLSNTNALHIGHVKQHVPFYEDFKSCFDAFYLSHEIKMRKPTFEIFNFVLEDNHMNAHETLFIDDTLENITSAKQLGFKTWHIDETTEDVSDLFQIKKDLF